MHYFTLVVLFRCCLVNKLPLDLKRLLFSVGVSVFLCVIGRPEEDLLLIASTVPFLHVALMSCYA